MTDKTINIDIKGDSSAFRKASTEAAKATQDLAQQINQTALSARQTSFAMRQVPAQLTDIVVSLQGGQSAMQVLLQQGGQLKDLFGGIVPAAKALGGYIVGLVNPYTVATAAAAAFGAAYYYGAEQVTRMNTALITSGNILGTTRGEMEALVQSTGKATGAYSTAREAAEALAGSGLISSTQLDAAMRGVTSGVQLTGKSVQDLVADFEKLAQDPLKTLFELNKRYNFLTIDTYKQVEALVEQGKQQEAVKLASEAYAKAIEGRKDQVLNNLGSIEKAWAAIKRGTSAAIDAALGVGREDSLQEQLLQAQSKLEFLQSKSPNGRFGRIATENQIAAQIKLVEDLNRQIKTSNTLAKEAAQFQQDQNKKIQDEVNAKAEKAPKVPKVPRFPNSSEIYVQEMKDLAALVQEIERASSSEKTHTQRLQEKINAFTSLDPALKGYLESQVQQIENAQLIAAHEAAVITGIDNQIEAMNEQSAAEQANLEMQQKSYADMAAAIQSENARLNVDLITNDRARAEAQVELEHQRSLERIGALALESDQAQELIALETENYKLAMKKVDVSLSTSKSLARDLGLTFNSAFEQAIVGGAKFQTVLQGIAKDLLQVATRRMVTEPLLKQLDGVLSGFSFGNLFSGGSTAGQRFLDGKPISGEVFDHLNSFAVGTGYVTHDQIAKIHKGEEIIPAGKAMRSEGNSIAIAITVNADGTSQQSGSTQANDYSALAKNLEAAVTNIVTKFMLPGGILARR